MSKPRKMLVADLLCGAGGSSTGCARALRELGLDMELVCVNHWPVAIETHTRNHPEARHYVQDISTVRPHIIVPEGYLDLLMASPTCTHHSVARGGKPTSDQQRSDPWHIITWLTELRVKRVIIENVWEFVGWGPVDPRTGKPIKSRKGEYFKAWIETLRRLNFEPEWRKLNAADYGDATTRQRFILMARSDSRSVSWPVATHRKREIGKLEFFPGLKPWRPAREIIDWSLKGKSIFARPRPLASKTLARILAGAIKFGWPEPYIKLLLAEIDRSLRFAIGWTFERRNRARSLRIKRRALVLDLIARLRHFRLEPMAFVRGGRSVTPMLITLRRNAHGRSITLPLPTIAANGTHIGLAEPIVLSQHTSGAPRGADDPLPTITTGGAGAEKREGCARPMLVEPLILNRNSAPRGETRPVSEPAPTPTTSGGGYLIEPFVLPRQGGGAPRAVDEPTPSQVAKHSHCLISPYYGSGSGETCISAETPLPTITSIARFGMVVPITHSGEHRARDIDTDPIQTVTTAHRGELAFITAQHGEREGQSPRVHDVDNPAPTIAATGHIDLVQATPEYDILFRMLEPHELAAAMGFDDDAEAYDFAGTKTEKIKQIGNAVSVRKMKACVGALMADSAPKQSLPEVERAIA
jgi:DNA (cytosine-5)-methyltransferase 1